MIQTTAHCGISSILLTVARAEFGQCGVFTFHHISFRSFGRVHFGVSVAVARISNGSDLGDTEESLAESMRIEIRFAELKFDSLN